MPKPKKPVTQMQQLADLASVSRATVSRALGDSPLVNEATKARIRALADEHSYQVNQRARNFRLQRTNVIAVVMMLDVKSHQHMSDPFFLEILGGIADGLAEHDYDLLLAHSPIENLLDLRSSRTFAQSDGVIFVGQGVQHERLNAIARDGNPIVVWGANLPNKDYCLVGGDNEHGGYLAAGHLLNAGRRKIAFFGNIELPEIHSRYAGYLKAHEERGRSTDDLVVLDVPFEMIRARATLEDLLDSGADIDGAVCGSDVMALSAIATFTERGVRVPDDVAIVGYDDIALAAYSSPPLTTIRQNIRWSGKVLVESLLNIIKGETVSDTVLSAELIVRRSCGVAANK